MDMKPTDAWGDVIYANLTEEQETWYEDGYHAGYEHGYRQALVESIGVVTVLFVAEADAENDDAENDDAV